jgi:hypothetical protein
MPWTKGHDLSFGRKKLKNKYLQGDLKNGRSTIPGKVYVNHERTADFFRVPALTPF